MQFGPTLEGATQPAPRTVPEVTQGGRFNRHCNEASGDAYSVGGSSSGRMRSSHFIKSTINGFTVENMSSFPILPSRT